MSKSLAAVTAICVALPLMALPALAKSSGVNVGGLSCTVDGGIGLIIGSSKSMKCRFDPAGGGKPQYYKGTVGKFGIDVGVTGKSYIKWLVFAPGKVSSGALAGTYAGVSAEASVGVGLGANVLVGGLKKSIALQPVSIQGQTGLNVAAGFGSMTLKAM